jgi:hypothetical protein
MEGDHFTTLKPTSREDSRYQVIREALLEPVGHRHVHEIELFEQRLRVEPLSALRTFTFNNGNITRVVDTDNLAEIVRAVTFSRKTAVLILCASVWYQI